MEELSLAMALKCSVVPQKEVLNRFKPYKIVLRIKQTGLGYGTVPEETIDPFYISYEN